MDNENGVQKSESPRPKNIKPSNVIFFLNNDLVKVIHRNKPNNICSLYNYTQNKEQNMLYSDFRKYRKRAFTVANTSRILKRSRVHLERMIASGLIPKPTGLSEGGKRKWQIMSYYSEDDLFTIREVLSNIHSGRPRKDGRITPRKDVISERDLRSLLGDGIMLYTKTEDGRFIPVWQEETW